MTRLDAYTFHEGFAHLLSYQATEIDCVDWHTPELTEVAAASRAKLRLALTETDPDRQKQFLEEAVCGSYYEKFACMCGMLYLADRWETQGIDGLQSAFADYHGLCSKGLEHSNLIAKEEETRMRLFLFYTFSLFCRQRLIASMTAA